jgi:HK97 family phage prohead protease
MPRAIERRLSLKTALRVERAQNADGTAGPPAIVGHASVFDQWTTIYASRYYEWREIIRPGAYKRAIAEKQDVRALFNHDANFVLGRTTSGTLELAEDKVGLLTRTVPPGTGTINDLVIAPIERGDITGMSFAFLPREAEEQVITAKGDGVTVYFTGGERITVRYEGEKRIEEHEVLDCDLFDISPVTFPAYEGTDVAMRSRWMGIEDRIREFDRPHKVPAPRRDSLRQWLSSFAGTPAGEAKGK